MASSYPYISSGGPLVQAITQFRRSFPATVDATTLKKLGLASANESYLINILKFLKLIDEAGKKTEAASKAFVQHKDDDFQKAFAGMVENAYRDLFDLHKNDAWTLDEESLITYFRQSDQSTEIVGKRQAITFKALSGIAGKREISAPRAATMPRAASKEPKARNKSKKRIVSAAETPNVELDASPRTGRDNGFGLTVRVEINLPSDGSQATYDRIFKSIKENLLDAYKA